jgi:hypothetical protein
MQIIKQYFITPCYRRLVGSEVTNLFECIYAHTVARPESSGQKNVKNLKSVLENPNSLINKEKISG